MSEIHAKRHEYQRWLDGVRDSGMSPTLADYRKWAQFDDNLFWRLACGDHLNLLDEAIEALDRVRAVALSIWTGTSGGMFTVLADLQGALGISVSDLGRPAVPLDAFDDLSPDERPAAVEAEMAKRRATLSEPTKGGADRG